MRTDNLNMLIDPVFPVVTAAGARRWANFTDLLVEDGDYPTGFDWPRGDLNVACMELAIGLLALIYRPSSNKDWLAIWNGRSDVDVAERIATLEPCFNLFGDREGKGPRFCQDLEPLEGRIKPVEGLFVDSAGENAIEKNSDLLTRRGRFPTLGLRSAAMALYALQQMAPEGGPGFRTSIRGGGPMSTFVILYENDGKPAPLRRTLLVNLTELFGSKSGWLEDEELCRALPWLQPTIVDRPVAEADPAVHSVQAFFGMPRRIHLVSGSLGICPITGEVETQVTGLIQPNYGTNYSEWRHPLAPYRQNKKGVFPLKPSAGRMGFRDWICVTIGTDDRANLAFPAENVRSLTVRTRQIRERGYNERLLVAGWATSTATADRFVESVQPLYLVADGDGSRAHALAETARAHADAAEAAVRLLRGAINDALFGVRAKATDRGVFEEVTDAFYERTELAFHSGLRRIAEDAAATPPARDAMARAWLATIRNAALRLFDAHVTDLLAERLDAGFAERATTAYGRLAGSLAETGKIAQSLGVSQPPGEKRNRKGREAVKQEAGA